MISPAILREVAAANERLRQRRLRFDAAIDELHMLSEEFERSLAQYDEGYARRHAVDIDVAADAAERGRDIRQAMGIAK